MPGVTVEPKYASGAYFRAPLRHAEDAAFKADHLLRLLQRVAAARPLTVRSYADVGCGSGIAAEMIARGLEQAGWNLTTARAYDVSPHVAQLRSDRVEYVHGDFCAEDTEADLVTMFDVFEHVVAPVEFLRAVSMKCRLLGLHIPLDDSLNHALRDKFRALLDEPGHLVYLNAVSALNLLAVSGLRVLDYEYTFAFRAPSGRRTFKAKAVYPVRAVLGALSPWLLSRVLGGASLAVLAATPRVSATGASATPSDSFAERRDG